MKRGFQLALVKKRPADEPQGGGAFEGGISEERSWANTFLAFRSGGWRIFLPALLLGGILFHFWGNTVRGYIDTPSLWVWWVRQWFTPGAELEHAPLLLAGAVWIWHREWLRGAPDFADPLQLERAIRPLFGVACGLLVAALFLHAGGLRLQQTRLSLVAVLLMAFALASAIGGRRAIRALCAPAILYLGTVPMGFLGDELGFQLRLVVIKLAHGCAELGGIALQRSGTLLSAPDGSYLYDVAPACSGVRSLSALLALVLALGVIEFRTWCRRLALLSVAPLLIVLGNLLRLLGIILAAEWGGEAWGQRVHEWLGFLVFLVVLAGAWALARNMHRFWPEAQGATAKVLPVVNPAAPPSLRCRWKRRRQQAALSLMSLLLASLPLFDRLAEMPGDLPSGLRLAPNGTDPARLPVRLPPDWWGRPVEVSAVEREILPRDTGFSRKIYRNPAGQDVLFSIVLSGRDRSSLHRPELCLVGQGWTIRQREVVSIGDWDRELFPVPTKLTRLSLERQVEGQRVRAVMLYFYVGKAAAAATTTGRLWQDVWRRLTGKPTRWAYVVLQTLVPDDPVAANRQLEAFLQEIWPVVIPASPFE